jgi:Mn-dependent DtxR family transcriptional regulator
MPLDMQTFKNLKGRKTNLELIIEFLEKSGEAWSVSELAKELNLDPAIISQISRKHDGRELVRKQDGKRVWIALKDGGISMEIGERAKDLEELVNDYITDKKAKVAIDFRNNTCKEVRSGLGYSISAEDFQKLIKPMRGESNLIRNNRFGNRIKTQGQLNALLDAIESTSFEEAAETISHVDGIGMDVLTMMLHIRHPGKYHCVNGQVIGVIDKMMERGLLPRRSLHKYTTTKSIAGLRGFIDTYKDYEQILNAIQKMGKMDKARTDFFIGWVDHDMRRRYSLGDVSLSGL